jgi:hypothetical protein
MAKKPRKTRAEQRAARKAERAVHDPTYPFFDPDQHDPMLGRDECYGDRPRAEQEGNPDKVEEGEACLLSGRMTRFTLTGRPVPFTFVGIDAMVFGKILRDTLDECTTHAKALSVAVTLFRQTRDASDEQASAGSMCKDDCDEHDTREECVESARQTELDMLEDLHDVRIVIKRTSDLYNSYVQQMRGFCRRLPPLAVERKGKKIKPPTPEIMEDLMRDLQGFPGLSEDDRK